MSGRRIPIMLRIAIVGCGKLADQAVEHNRLLATCRIVAVCDRDQLMAGQLGERLNVQARFTDAAELLEATKPDVVHITTPPQSHYALAKLCLEAGSAVYVEKPFTLIAAEAKELVK